MQSHSSVKFDPQFEILVNRHERSVEPSGTQSPNLSVLDKYEHMSPIMFESPNQ